MRTSETKGKIGKTGLIQEVRNLDVRFSGYAYGEGRGLESDHAGDSGLSGKDEIIETARSVRESSKKEAAVKNRRCGNQEGKGLHKP